MGYLLGRGRMSSAKLLFFFALVVAALSSCHRSMESAYIANYNQGRPKLGGPLGTTPVSQLRRFWSERPDYVPYFEQSRDLPNPKLLAINTDPFPDSYRKDNQMVWVKIALLVNESGTVEDVKILQSSGSPLNSQILKDFRDWRFVPAKKDGKAVKVVVVNDFTFSPPDVRAFNWKMDDAEKAGKANPFRYPNARYRKLWADRPAYVALLEKRPITRLPRALSTPRPETPPHLKLKDGRGGVDVSYVIGNDGRIEEARVIESTARGLNEPVLKVIRQWRFAPAHTASGPVRMLWEQRLLFVTAP